MLDISYTFEDANVAMRDYAELLAVAPLPAAAYMMQLDVMNHCRHALTHYFMLTLDEPYLQNSSLGTPYQKWAFFVNRDFEMLSLAVQNLLRYTSRLLHETLLSNLIGRNRELTPSPKFKSNMYTGPLCDIKHKRKQVGIRVENDQRLEVSRIRPPSHGAPVIMRGVANGPVTFVRCTNDATGQDIEIPTDRAEFDRAMEWLEVETVDIRDRSRLKDIRDRGSREIAALAEHNHHFRALCSAYYASHKVAEPFKNLNQEFWM
jgi:hypothetical protein